MSYALDSKDSDAKARDQAFNHFVVFDAYDLIACHDFQVSKNLPEPARHPHLFQISIYSKHLTYISISKDPHSCLENANRTACPA